MISVEELYENKSAVCAKDDFSGLINCLSKQNISAVDNYDRTILVYCSNENIVASIDAAIVNWMRGYKLTCSPQYLYNILPLAKNQFIIRI